ncbi:hypothetical protein BpHYR1_012404, partial [Brachionus plicatilis]
SFLYESNAILKYLTCSRIFAKTIQFVHKMDIDLLLLRHLTCRVSEPITTDWPCGAVAADLIKLI